MVLRKAALLAFSCLYYNIRQYMSYKIASVASDSVLKFRGPRVGLPAASGDAAYIGAITAREQRVS